MGRRRSIRDWRENGSRGWLPALGTRGFQRPLSDPSTDLQIRCHGSGRDGRDVPKPAILQAVFGQLAATKIVNDTERLARDPATRASRKPQIAAARRLTGRPGPSSEAFRRLAPSGRPTHYRGSGAGINVDRGAIW